MCVTSPSCSYRRRVRSLVEIKSVGGPGGQNVRSGLINRPALWFIYISVCTYLRSSIRRRGRECSAKKKKTDKFYWREAHTDAKRLMVHSQSWKQDDAVGNRLLIAALGRSPQVEEKSPTNLGALHNGDVSRFTVANIYPRTKLGRGGGCAVPVFVSGKIFEETELVHLRKFGV